MKGFHKLISTLLHPILFPVITTIIYFILHRNILNLKPQLQIISIVAVTTYFIPVLLLFVSKKLKLIKSIELKKTKHQKIALIFLTVLFYFLGHSFQRLNELESLSNFFLGASLALATSYMFLLKKVKISLHLVSLSSFLAFMIIYSIQSKTNITYLLTIIFLLIGLLSNARIKLKENSLSEIYFGILIGTATQLIKIVLPILLIYNR